MHIAHCDFPLLQLSLGNPYGRHKLRKWHPVMMSPLKQLRTHEHKSNKTITGGKWDRQTGFWFWFCFGANNRYKAKLPI